jgi:hypothetical protein
MSAKYKVLCGVPDEHCNGHRLVTDQHFTAKKCHMTHPEAFRCMANYLVHVVGAVRISTKEFRMPDTGYIRVLPRQSHFGGHLRAGKEQARFMPNDKNAQANRGLIV